MRAGERLTYIWGKSGIWGGPSKIEFHQTSLWSSSHKEYIINVNLELEKCNQCLLIIHRILPAPQPVLYCSVWNRACTGSHLRANPILMRKEGTTKWHRRQPTGKWAMAGRLGLGVCGAGEAVGTTEAHIQTHCSERPVLSPPWFRLPSSPS